VQEPAPCTPNLFLRLWTRCGNKIGLFPEKLVTNEVYLVSKTGKVLLMDGNSLAYRAFYALPPLTSQEGLPTNAVYGFTTMFLKILEQEKPDCVVVPFDAGRVTFRNDSYADYKGQRKPTPPELKSQLPLIHQVLEALGITICQLANYEADDLLGTLSLQAEEAGLETVIVTGDRDALQLVSPYTRVLLTKKGISQMESYTLETIETKYGLKPGQLIDVKGLMGDASDNIPGVPGIGEKTAVKLIREFGSLENVLQNIERIKGQKLKESLGQYRDQALMSYDLATIRRNAPLDLEIINCSLKQPDYEKILELFNRLEFRSLIDKVPVQLKGAPVLSAAVPGREMSFRRAEGEELCSLLAALRQVETVAVYLMLDSGDYRSAGFRALGLSWTGPAGENLVLDRWTTETARFCEELFESGCRTIWWDGKAAMVWLEKQGVHLEAPADDCFLAAYLLNPSQSHYDLEQLVAEYLGRPPAGREENPGAAAAGAKALAELEPVLNQKLAALGMQELYRDLELPLERVLADMELHGVAVDLNRLELLGAELDQKLAELTGEIYDLAGEEFNLNSPRQLGAILFEKLGLPAGKKTKTGYSTDAAVLEELAPRHQIVAKILDYRQLAKLKSTYIDGLKPLVDRRTGLVHTLFNQTVTATGRLSSAEPNLQNIPVRLEEGRKIRKVFHPVKPEDLFLAADYSQIELRILAHFAGDQNLISAFLEGEDIHTATAAEVFGLPRAEVTAELRRRAKAVNFGIVYGISDFGLARDLGISRREAGAYIDRYFERFPGVKAYLDRTVARAREEGFVTTLLNRRRYLPDILSSNRNQRSFGERTAMNTPIQGSAADIIKLAMLKVHRELKEQGLKGKLLLQVHDELILEVPREELLVTARVLQAAMEGAVKLAVPLTVDLKAGPNWYDLEPLDLTGGEGNA